MSERSDFRPGREQIAFAEQFLRAMDHLTPADLPGLKAYANDPRLVKVVDMYLSLPPEGKDKFKRRFMNGIKRILNRRDVKKG